MLVCKCFTSSIMMLRFEIRAIVMQVPRNLGRRVECLTCWFVLNASTSCKFDLKILNVLQINNSQIYNLTILWILGAKCHNVAFRNIWVIKVIDVQLWFVIFKVIQHFLKLGKILNFECLNFWKLGCVKKQRAITPPPPS